MSAGDALGCHLNKARMKITFVLPLASTNGGIRVVATYARILHERGHDVTVMRIEPISELEENYRKID